MKPESRLLDDAQRTAGLAGAGYPIRAGDETFHLGRLTKAVKARYAAKQLEQAEENLRAMAGIVTAEAYAKLCREHKDQRDAREWEYGGRRCHATLGSLEGMEYLALLLLEHHHPGIDPETVSWLLALYSCPACKWRGVRPTTEEGVECGNCGAVPELGAETKCCKRPSLEEWYACPKCSAPLECVQDQITEGIRELSSADPRIPPRGAASDNGTAPSA